MAEHSSVNGAARWRMVTLTGGTSFVVSFALFHFVLPVSAWAGSVPKSMVSLFLAGLVAVAAMAIAKAVLARKLHVDNQRLGAAINNMSQGLCMFDGYERLVVCNRRYMEMYRLSPDIVKPGINLTNLLEYRISNGSFTRDPVEY